MELASIIGIDLVGSGGLILIGGFAVWCVLQMCEYTQLYQSKYSHLPLSEIIFGRCPFCGEYLTVDEMWPSGHCSRSLCQSCYNKMFGHINPVCAAPGCGNDIQHKVPMQQANLREVSNHICDSSKCQGEWAKMHTSVTGLSRADATRKMKEFRGVVRPEYEDILPESRYRYGLHNQHESPAMADADQEPIHVYPADDDPELEEIVQECLRLVGAGQPQIEYQPVKMIEHDPQETLDDWKSQGSNLKQKEPVWNPVKGR